MKFSIYTQRGEDRPNADSEMTPTWDVLIDVPSGLERRMAEALLFAHWSAAGGDLVARSVIPAMREDPERQGWVGGHVSHAIETLAEIADGTRGRTMSFLHFDYLPGACVKRRVWLAEDGRWNTFMRSEDSATKLARLVVAEIFLQEWDGNRHGAELDAPLRHLGVTRPHGESDADFRRSAFPSLFALHPELAIHVLFGSRHACPPDVTMVNMIRTFGRSHVSVAATLESLAADPAAQTRLLAP